MTEKYGEYLENEELLVLDGPHKGRIGRCMGVVVKSVSPMVLEYIYSVKMSNEKTKIIELSEKDVVSRNQIDNRLEQAKDDLRQARIINEQWNDGLTKG